jgi:putative ABC transport system permease protein
MQRWLVGFESRIELAWWMFALAGLIALGVALFTVSIQSVKAAMVNPVDSLKNE